MWIGTKPVHVGDDHLDNINHTTYKVRKTLIGKQKGKSPHFEYIIQYLDRVKDHKSDDDKKIEDDNKKIESQETNKTQAVKEDKNLEKMNKVVHRKKNKKG